MDLKLWFPPLFLFLFYLHDNYLHFGGDFVCNMPLCASYILYVCEFIFLRADHCIAHTYMFHICVETHLSNFIYTKTSGGAMY